MSSFLVNQILITIMLPLTVRGHDFYNDKQYCTNFNCSTVLSTCDKDIQFDKLRTDIMSLLTFKSLNNQNVTLAFHPCLPDCSFYTSVESTYAVDFSSIKCAIEDDTVNLFLNLSEVDTNVNIQFPFRKLKYYPPYVVWLFFLLRDCTVSYARNPHLQMGT